MEHPVFQNRVLMLLYALLWTVISLSISIAIVPLSPASRTQCAVWGFTSGYLFAGISLPLWNILKYADYSAQNKWQATFSYLALGSITVGAWIGIVYLVFNFLLEPESDDNWIIQLMPLQFLLGACFFTIAAFAYNNNLKKIKEDEVEMELEKIETEAVANISEEPKEIIERIAIKIRQKIEVVLVSDIVFIQSEGDYTMIHTANSRFLKEQTMKYFELHLPANLFVRIHRSYIVNVLAISKVELFEKQTYRITLKSGVQIKASAAGYKLLKNTLSL
jgi:LytTr DNA-binding domain